MPYISSHLDVCVCVCVHYETIAYTLKAYMKQ